MGKTTGFLEYERRTGDSVSADKRIKNFDEFHATLSLEEQQEQGARCMACGVPFCQYGGMIAGMTSVVRFIIWCQNLMTLSTEVDGNRHMSD